MTQDTPWNAVEQGKGSGGECSAGMTTHDMVQALYWRFFGIEIEKGRDTDQTATITRETAAPTNREAADCSHEMAPAVADCAPGTDRTPDEQRAGFEAVVAEGRPTTVEVKAALDDAERSAQWIGGESQSWGANWRCGAAGIDGVHHARDLRSYAGLIDRLGCALIAQDTRLHEAEVARDRAITARAELSEKLEFAQGEARRLSAANGELNAKLASVETFDITKPRDTRQDALLAMNVLDSFVTGDVFTFADAGRIKGTIRQLLAERDDMEVHRDAARDALSDAIAERDDAQRDAHSDRANLAASVGPWLWVHEVATRPWVPATLRAQHWGGPIGGLAEALVGYLRNRVVELEGINEAV